MDSPPTLHPAPAGYTMVPTNEVVAVNSNRRAVNMLTVISSGELLCVTGVLLLWLCAAVMLEAVNQPTDLWIGSNSSILLEPKTHIFLKSIKVEEVDDSKSAGLELFGFYASPPVDVLNWSESHLASVSYKSYKGWPYYLNEGSSLNISYNIKPEGCSVQFVVNEGMDTPWLLKEAPYYAAPLSLNTIQGSGMIQVNISKSQGYHIAVANPNFKDIEVELDIDVMAVVYDTKEPFYKCTFSNGECTFNTMPLVGTPIVLTSPALRPGLLAEEQEWVIRISYEARWSSYAIVTCLLTSFMLVLLRAYRTLYRAIEEIHVMDDDDSSVISLLVNKDDDGSSVCSWSESFAADGDGDLEDFICNESEASYETRPPPFAICFVAQ